MNEDARLMRPRDAAKVLGISYATLKLWIYKGKIRTNKTAGGHHRIPESQLDKFLHSASEKGEVATKRTGFRNISGRNQLIGRVTDIKISGLIAWLSASTIHRGPISPQHRALRSSITAFTTSISFARGWATRKASWRAR